MQIEQFDTGLKIKKNIEDVEITPIQNLNNKKFVITNFLLFKFWIGVISTSSMFFLILRPVSNCSICINCNLYLNRDK